MNSRTNNVERKKQRAELNTPRLVEERVENRPGAERVGECDDAERQRVRLLRRDEGLPEDGEQHENREAQEAQARRLDDVKMTFTPLFLLRALVGIRVEDFVRDAKRIPDKSDAKIRVRSLSDVL
jgi:hypothetical protein